MALFIMLIRKMVQNKWLQISLTIGLIMTVALMSSIPIFSSAINQRAIVKSLEELQSSQQFDQKYPGTLVTTVFREPSMTWEETTDKLHEFDIFMDQQIMSLDLSVDYYFHERLAESRTITPASGADDIHRTGDIIGMEDLNEHIALISGRMPSKEPVDGIYEALVIANATRAMNIALDKVYIYDDPKTGNQLQLKPVGIMQRKDTQDTYFFGNRFNNSSYSFYIDYETFTRDFIAQNLITLRGTYYYYTFDYKQFDEASVVSFMNAVHMITRTAERSFTSLITAPAVNILNVQSIEKEQMNRLLMSLNVPVLIMLAFYLFMISQLIVERQRGEISVLRSRGASRMQVMMAYAAEGAVMGVIALAAGPPLGLIYTRMLGLANGFLEFVDRTSLHVRLHAEVYGYSLAAIGISLFMTFIPVFFATRKSVVTHKQEQSRSITKGTFIHWLFLDVILLGISLYGYFSNTGEGAIDNRLFLMPTLFILGLGILILRVYPWIIRFIFWLGRKMWSPSLYGTLLQVARQSVQYQYVMLFIILTIAVGMYNTTAERTMNTNEEEQILHRYSAPITIKFDYTNMMQEKMVNVPLPTTITLPGRESKDNAYFQAKMIEYGSPPLDELQAWPEIEQSTQVLMKQGMGVETALRKDLTATLMGIEPKRFGETVWFKRGLGEYHWFGYLNLLGRDPRGVLISRGLADELRIQLGDEILVNVDTAQFSGWDIPLFQYRAQVFGIIDYFPGYYPIEDGEQVHLVVADLHELTKTIGVQPISLWLKLRPEADLAGFYSKLEQSRLPIAVVDNNQDRLIEQKNDPYTLGLNGTLTMGFIMTVMICLLGYMIFWILNIRSRQLHYGMLRAIGFTKRRLSGMIIVEQLLTSGASIMWGMIAGKTASGLFVPLFQMFYHPEDLLPPFEIVTLLVDMVRLMAIVSVMVAAGIVVLSLLISNIKIHQAIKLGEDA